MTLIEYDIIPDGGSNCFSVSGAGDLRITDANWALAPGSGDWLWAGWVKLTSKSTQQIMVGQYANTGSYTDNRSYLIYYQPTATDRFGIVVCTDGTSGGNTTVYDAVLGSPSTGVWYFIEAGRIGSTLSIRVTSEGSGSRNSATTTAYSGDTFNAGCQFAFGSFFNYTGTSPTSRQSPLSGQLDEWLYWQGTLPSSGELDDIFNAGAGISKREFIDAGILYPSAAFTLDEISGSRYSWDRTRQLTASGTTSYAAGKVASGDFTSLSTAIAYAQANKVAADEWEFTCYSGNIEPATAYLSSIPTTSTGTVTFMPAVGAEHDGTFDNRQAAAFGNPAGAFGHFFIADGDADNLDPASGDFVISCWVLLTDLTNTFKIMSKLQDAGNQRSYTLYFNSSGQRFILYSTPAGDGTGSISVVANNFGAPTAGVWYFVEAGRQSGNVFIAVNRGTRDTAAFAGTYFNNTIAVEIGRFNGLNSNGLLDELYYWHSSGSLPTTGDLDDIYNSGAGICKREFIEQGLPMPYDAWSFEYRDGMTASWGTAQHTLTQLGTVGYEIGHIEEDRAAYITGNVVVSAQDDCIIKNLQFEGALQINAGITDILIDGNLLTTVGIYPYNGDIDNLVFQNNLLLAKPSSIAFYIAGYCDSGDSVYDIHLLNNTIIGFADGSSLGVSIEGFTDSATITYTGDIKNNIFLEDFAGDTIAYSLDGGATNSWVFSTNITDDSSGDITGETFASTFVDADNQDFTPLNPGPAYRSGIAGLVTYDIEGTLRHVTPDIGAYEAAGPYSTDYEITPTGGLILNSNSVINRGYYIEPTGGLLLNSNSILNRGYYIEPTGGLLLNSNSILNRGYYITATGGLLLNSDSILNRGYTITPVGGLILNSNSVIDSGTVEASSIEIALVTYLKEQITDVDNRVYPYWIPRAATLPAIAVHRRSGNYRHQLDGSAGFASPEFQISVFSNDYFEAKELTEAARLALEGYTGPMGAENIFAITLSNQFDLYEQPQDATELAVYHSVSLFDILYEIITPTCTPATGEVTNAHIEPAVRGYLLDQSALTALIGNRLYALQLPRKATYPAVTFDVTAVEQGVDITGGAGFAKPRLEFTIFGNDYAELVIIRDKIRLLLDGLYGVHSGVNIFSITVIDSQDAPTAPADGSESWLYAIKINFNVLHQNTIPTL